MGMDRSQLQTFLTRGLGQAMATRDSKMRPEITEVLGTELSADGKRVTVFLESVESARALGNIADNGLIAVTLARPCDYFAAQIKGRAATARPITAAEVERSQIAVAKYHDEAKLIGISVEALNRLNKPPADIAIEADVCDIFVQTPGPIAGHPLGAK